MSSSSAKKDSMVAKIAAVAGGPAAAGLSAALYNWSVERNQSFATMPVFLRYAVAAAAANFVGTMGVSYVLPEFSSKQLRHFQHIALGAAATAALNPLAQQHAGHAVPDLRQQHNFVAGAIGGAAGAVGGDWLAGR